MAVPGPSAPAAPPGWSDPFFTSQVVTVTAASLWIDEAWAEVGSVGPLRTHRPAPVRGWWRVVLEDRRWAYAGIALLVLVIGGAAAAVLAGRHSGTSEVVAPATRPLVTAAVTTVPTTLATTTVPTTVAPTTTTKKSTPVTVKPAPAPAPAPAPGPEPTPEPPPADSTTSSSTTSSSTTSSSTTTTTTDPTPPTTTT